MPSDHLLRIAKGLYRYNPRENFAERGFLTAHDDDRTFDMMESDDDAKRRRLWRYMRRNGTLFDEKHPPPGQPVPHDGSQTPMVYGGHRCANTHSR